MRQDRRVIFLTLKKLIENRCSLSNIHLCFELCLSLRGESVVSLGFSKWYIPPKRSFIIELESNLFQFSQAMHILEKNLVISMGKKMYAGHFRYYVRRANTESTTEII